jgi:hypothetical protein
VDQIREVIRLKHFSPKTTPLKLSNKTRIEVGRAVGKMITICGMLSSSYTRKRKQHKSERRQGSDYSPARSLVV